jgi:hypothetical protein
MSRATNIFFISKPLLICDLYSSRPLPLSIIPNASRGHNLRS